MLATLFPMEPAMAFAVLATLAGVLIGLGLRAARNGQPFRYTGFVFGLGVVATLLVPVSAALLA